MPYLKDVTVITFSVKMYYIYGWLVTRAAGVSEAVFVFICRFCNWGECSERRRREPLGGSGGYAPSEMFEI